MRQQSVLIYLLKALVPYTRQNILLNYKPARFFAELSRTSGYSEATLKTTYFRARKAGFITGDATPCLTKRGKQKLEPFIAQKLKHGGKLMVIFDVPQSRDVARRQFRAVLRELAFTQVQQSVWMTSYDHRAYIKEVVEEMKLQDCVQMYEAARLPL